MNDVRNGRELLERADDLDEREEEDESEEVDEVDINLFSDENSVITSAPSHFIGYLQRLWANPTICSFGRVRERWRSSSSKSKGAPVLGLPPVRAYWAKHHHYHSGAIRYPARRVYAPLS